MAFMDFVVAYPRTSIIIISLAVALVITLINSLFMNKERMREIKKRQKELQKEIKEHQKAGNHDKVMQLNKEMFSFVGETFKHSLTPMLITIIPILIL